MDNRKRNVHNSGPLGMLVKSGQIKKIDDDAGGNVHLIAEPQAAYNTTTNVYFKTHSGIKFEKHDLIFVDPDECEPWVYANRQADELGDMDELMRSIKENKQLQPALIRNHPKPHGNVKYEIIFGRRRHIACLKLGVPFLAIHKDIPNVQDAIASQDAENKLRNDVSNYSNAKLYKKLLQDGVFRTEKELAEKLHLSTSTLNDLMAYAKIPEDIVSKIPNIHQLSKNVALKIVQLLNGSNKNHEKIVSLASQIGHAISSPTKLETAVQKVSVKNKKATTTKRYESRQGKKLFTYRLNHRGTPCVLLNKEIVEGLDLGKMCKWLCHYLEENLA